MSSGNERAAIRCWEPPDEHGILSPPPAPPVDEIQIGVPAPNPHPPPVPAKLNVDAALPKSPTKRSD
jgi:hypothetical protein